MEFNGSTRLENREGGAHPLWIVELRPGIYTSAWATHNKRAQRALKKGRMAMTIVVDTNVPGCPSISVLMQPVTIVED